jgi:hypothetical protein
LLADNLFSLAKNLFSLVNNLLLLAIAQVSLAISLLSLAVQRNSLAAFGFIASSRVTIGAGIASTVPLSVLIIYYSQSGSQSQEGYNFLDGSDGSRTYVREF